MTTVLKSHSILQIEKGNKIQFSKSSDKTQSFKRGSHNKKGQATKSARGMPWHWEPMKDVVNCDKPRGAVSRRYIRGFPNGATQLLFEQLTYTESNRYMWGTA